jgi:ubiquinone/menaquinone biosynthesis C-methylase UbiE
MSRVEQAFCRSAPWRWFARDVVLPWALQGEDLRGDVLEIGSGSGAMAAGMLDRFADLHLTATDYDEQMVAACRDRLAPYGDRARVVRADATALDFPDCSFDAVVSFIMLHHVIEWEQALRECTRVLKPGGVLVGYDLLRNPVSRLIHIIDRSRNRLMTMSELDAFVPQLPGHARVQPLLIEAAVRFRVDTDAGGNR